MLLPAANPVSPASLPPAMLRVGYFLVSEPGCHARFCREKHPMPQTFTESQQEHRIPSWHFEIESSEREQTSAPYGVDQCSWEPGRTGYVLHREWGIGRVLD